MSVISAKTGLSSILKAYSPADRDRAKNAVINKVRFEMPREMGVVGALEAVLQHGNYVQYNEFISYLKECELSNAELLRVINEARKSVHILKPNFTALVESILSLDWLKRDNEAITYEFVEFYVDLLVAHSKYINFAISKLIVHWIPTDDEAAEWTDAYCPSEKVRKRLQHVHSLLDRLLTIIPMTFDVVLEAAEQLFPYYKKPTFIIGGYVHNILRLMEYKSNFTSYAIQLIFQKLLILDVNAPRNEIEDAEFEVEQINDDVDEPIFEMEECDKIEADVRMHHPIAETLDICMDKIFRFLANFKDVSNNNGDSKRPTTDLMQLFKMLIAAFENVILPSHNTHHVQFIIFYYCSFKSILAEKFLQALWSKVKDPNMSAPIRQAAVGYMASFLARSKFLPIVTVQQYLFDLCNWAHQYIRRSDSIRSNVSLKANIVFFSVCQAVFYVIAFRSRDLTGSKKDLRFLESLQLSALVTCTFNPLRVCLPPVATAFAGVTRAYQLAYCHTILERNARRKLATVYANETTMPEEVLETFFPFDPYLLKKSGKCISPIYLQYQPNEAEEESTAPLETSERGRKRGDSEMIEDVDDFIVDKRLKFSEMARSLDKDMQYNYGLSPGFNM